jgi:hypothetical protein
MQNIKDTDLLPLDHNVRLHTILDISWKIFKSQFIHERHPILKEAPFQHHFANIISTVGGLYCIQREDVFFVDLETKCENIKNKSKYLDITCEFAKSGIRCAIELKFKTAKQAAQDHGRIDTYVDIEALELACRAGYTFGKFYMITDSKTYVNESKKGVGTVFAIHHGFESSVGELWYPSKGREHVKVNFENPYKFEWEHFGGKYFLDLSVCDTSSKTGIEQVLGTGPG